MHTSYTNYTPFLSVLGARQNKSICIVILLMVWGLFIACPAYSSTSPLIINNAEEQLLLTDYLAYQPALGEQEYSITDLQRNTFLPLPAKGEALESKRDYWFKVQLRNEVPTVYSQAEWVLQFPLLLTDVYYVIVDSKGEVQEGRTGFFVKYSERTFAPSAKGNFAKIYLPAQEEVDVYLRIRSDRKLMPPRYEIKLMSSEHFFYRQKRKTQFNSIFLGFTLLILLYNLFVFFLARDRTFVYYSLYLLALLVFTVYNSGDLADMLLPTVFFEEPRWIYFFKLSVYPIIMGYLSFLRSFLDLKDLLPKWDGYFKKFSAVAYVGIVVDSIVMVATNFNYTLADSFGMVYMILFLIMQGLFLKALIRTSDPKRYFIIGGVLAMGVGIGLTLVERMITMEFSAMAYKIGTIIEIVIFSLGLVYRQREAEQQKQQAQFALERATMLRQQKEKEAAQIAEVHAAKEWFYTHITHELRTPLTVIMGMTKHLDELLEGAPLPTSTKKEWNSSIELIDRNSEHLHRQVNQLLDLARLESGAVELNLIEEDIIVYLGYLTESFYSLATDRGIDLTYNSLESALIMPYDELKIQQIVFNLLSNAIKFSRRGDRIELLVKLVMKKEVSYLEIQVVDTGIGISQDDLPGIFDPFFQADNRDQAVLGTGVGLALTKQLVNLMDGTIGVSSRVGEGSCFTILLPAPDYHTSVGHLTIQPTDDLTGTTNSSQPSFSQQPLLLIVEDNRDVVAYLEKILTAEYRLLIAREGASGLALARAELPDLIISDVMMPEMNGYELCQNLKSDRLTSHIPLILLTAKAEDADRLIGLKHGADAYLAKPFHPKELRLRLNNLQGLKIQLQEHYRKSQTTVSVLADPPVGVNEEDVIFLNKLKAIVAQHLSGEHLSAAFLATELHLSTNQLYRKLKALTDQTPTQFIRDARLRKARIRLQSTRTQIAEIAYQTGFSDPNYFSRAFNQMYGCSPREFRKSGK